MDVQRALGMRELGIPWNEIAEELGVPLYTVRYNCDLAGVERRHYGMPDEVIDQIKAMRARGLSWAAIECVTGYTASGMQRVLRKEKAKWAT